MSIPNKSDLSSLFTWNTKQVFVWITAKYPSKRPGDPPSEAVVWDAILPSKLEPYHDNQYIHPGPDPSIKPGSRRARSKTPPREYSSTVLPGILRLRGQKPKYQITDHTGLIAGRENATLELNWNIQPWVGALLWSRPSNLGVWKALKGGKTEPWTFPELKGSAPKPSDMGTVKGGEKYRGKPHIGN
jgi:signal peptidase complex subunit 3